MPSTRRERGMEKPVYADEFVGRDPELQKLHALLRGEARLVTLVGPGGIGKTRLATEALRRFRRPRSAPVYWVRLARLARDSNAVAVEDEIARSVVEADFPDSTTWDALVDTLSRTDALGRNQQTVLVMDNCEHVRGSSGRLIAELLAEVPGLTILATSREPVGWVDEHVVVVPPLTQQQAVTLFCQRAQLAGHTLVAPDDVAVAAQICRHMDNQPLFIRLAAARVQLRPLAMILSDLTGEETDRRMGWPPRPLRGVEPRHRRIVDAIAWSYDLCEEKEQLLLDRLSVFAAGYDTNPEDDNSTALDVGADLDAVETVCSDDPSRGGDEQSADHHGVVVRLAADEIEGLLERLADQSLVTLHVSPNTVRYSLLESVRIFAQQKLQKRSTDEVDEPARLVRRHRQYYRDKAVYLQRDWFSPAEQNWARAAWDNIVTAIEGSLTAGEPEVGLEICASLIALPPFKGSPREIRRWAERTLEAARMSTPQRIEVQVAALSLIGWLAMVQGRNEDVERILDDCIDTCIDDAMIRQNWRQDPHADVGLPAPIEFLWGSKLTFLDRDARAIEVLARACKKFQALGDSGRAARSELYKAWAACFLGSREEAIEIAMRHLDHARASGAGWAKAWAELAWATTLTKHGDPIQALAVERATLENQVAARDGWGAAFTVYVRTWSLAQIITDMLAAGNNDSTRLKSMATEIAQLAGGAVALRGGRGFDLNDLPLIANENNTAIEVARGVLGPEAFHAAYRQGSLLIPEADEVQRLALGTLAIHKMPMEHPARQNTASRWGRLSDAEMEVSVFAAAGWKNVEIAARRGTSSKTVDAQVAMVLRKLEIGSRQDIIKLAPKDLLDKIRTAAAKRPSRTHERRRHQD